MFRRTGALQRTSPQVRPNGKMRAFTEPDAIDLKVFHHALDVVAGFGEWDPLDPINGVNVRTSRITVSLDPFANPTTTCIIGRESEYVRPAIVLKQFAEFGCSHLGVVNRVGCEPLEVVADPESLGHIPARFRSDLHQTIRMGT